MSITPEVLLDMQAMTTQPKQFSIKISFEPSTESETDDIPGYQINQAFQEKGITLDAKTKPVIEQAGQRWSFKGTNGKWYRLIRTDTGLDIYEGNKRHYKSTILQTINNELPYGNSDKELIQMLYGQVCNNWRTLTDVRFKLLGLVPAVSIIAWGQLLSAETLKSAPGAYAGIAIGLVGFWVTLAIRLYDQRNDSLYDDLISRGRKIEDELGIDTGIFRGRVSATSRWVNHTRPLQIIYGSAMGGWLAISVWFVLAAAQIV